jgi:hypothetical protein
MKIRIPTALKVAATAFYLGAMNVLAAQELEAEAEKAKATFMNILKLGLGVMSAVVMVSGLVLSAVKFSKKDDGALWYLLGTIGASVLLGAASAFAAG